jgi:hypothetical protein
MTATEPAGMLHTTRRAMEDLERVVACVAPYAESLTLWVTGEQFAAWAHVIGAKVMHTMRNGNTDSTFAWVTNDASGRGDVRIGIYTHDAPAPWVTFPPHGAEGTKRFVINIAIDEPW